VSQLGFEPVFGSYLAVIIVAAALLATLAVRPQYGSLSKRRARVLNVLQFIAVLLAILALLRPTWITTIKSPRLSTFLVLLDTSRSMNLPSGRSDQKRWQAQQAALMRAQDELGRLAAKAQVRVIGYDQKLHPLEFSAGRIKFPDGPIGEQTDIGTCLSQALAGEQGKPLAGVLLLGDGAQTAFDPQVETQQAARRVRDDFAAPLYTVTFGLAGDAAQARDIAIDRLDEQFTVFVKNELVVRGLVRIRGYAKQDLPVELLLTDEKNHTQSIGRRMIRASEDNRQVEVEFPHTPQTPGHYRLTLRADPQPDEQVTKNNSLDAFLTVLEGGLRVLYLYGNLPFEQRAVRRAINASPDIELDDYYVDPRNRQRWPVDLPRDFTTKYDAFILGDVDQAALGPANDMRLAAAVEKGKGLLMLGGNGSFGRGHWRGTKIGEALPIAISSVDSADFSGPKLEELFIKGPAMIPVGSHAITRLSGDADNAAIWSRLPPLAWANRFSGIKQESGVRILLESQRGEPLLVSGEYGAGRTLAFAGDSTYRWPLLGFGREHNRFWRQIILWLVKHDDTATDNVWIKLDQRRLNPGTKLAIRAGARSAAGDPLAGARLDTTVVHPGGRREPLNLTVDKDEFHGSLQPSAAGDYAIETTAYEGNRLVGTARSEFLVFDRDVELSTPAADPDLMQSLAAWTRQEGGRAVAPEDLPELIAELNKRPPEYEVRQTRWKLAGTSGDAWVFFFLLTAVLAGEWFLRKRWGLV
jgi:uncharacterized membrane protein